MGERSDEELAIWAAREAYARSIEAKGDQWQILANAYRSGRYDANIEIDCAVSATLLALRSREAQDG